MKTSLKFAIINQARKINHSVPFDLTSGGASHVYFDIKSICLSPVGELVAECIWDRIKELNFATIGGIATGSIPLIALVCNFAWRKDRREIHGFYFKKDGKLVGQIKSNVILLEDVVTTGNSIIQVADSIHHQGHRIELILAVVDRRKDKSKTLKSFLFDSFFKDTDLIERNYENSKTNFNPAQYFGRKIK